MLEGITTQQLIFGACLFGAVALVAFIVSGALLGNNKDPLRQRLQAGRSNRSRWTGMGDSADDAMPLRAAGGGGGMSPAVQRITRAVATPLMPKDRAEASRLRRQFARAGIYATYPIHLFVMSKILICLAGIAAGLFLAFTPGEPMIGILLATTLGLVGMVVPSIWLRWKISRRQWSLHRALPDALDLMVVCVEAGLTIDAAIQRVGQEIALAHPDISRELGITHMETRVGVSRIDALRNLGLRTGNPALQSLAAMLVQAERFGTSIGTALRVHSESLRVKCHHAAEERAAKTTVKLAFPVVLFIFPTVIAVLGGPAFILLYTSPIFNR